MRCLKYLRIALSWMALLIVLAFAPHASLAQTPESTDKITELNDLAWDNRAIDPVLSRQYSKKAMELAIKIEDDNGLSEGMVIYGHGFLNEGNLDSAEYWFREGLELREANGDTRGVASCYNNLGIASYLKGDFEEAIELWEMANNLTKEESGSKFKGLQADISRHLGVVFRDIGNWEQSFLKLHESLEGYKELNNPIGVADLNLNLGSLMELQGNYFQAMDYYQKALKFGESVDYDLMQGNALINIGGLYLRIGELEKAHRLTYKGIELKSQYQPDSNLAMAYINLGLIQTDLGKLAEAISYFDQAKSIYQKQPYHDLGITLFNSFGYTRMLQGNFLLAQQDFEEALKLINKTGNLTKKPEILSNLARVSILLEEYGSANNYSNLLEIEIDSVRTRMDQLNSLKLTLLENRLTLDSVEKRQSLIISAAIVVSLLILLLFGALFYSYRSRKKEQLADQRATIAEINEQVNRQRLEEQLRKQELEALNLRMEIQQTERKRIAQELHDDLGGTLSYIILKLRSAEEKFDQKLNEYVDAMGHLDGAVEKVRNISHKMEAGMPGDFEVAHAIRKQVESVEESGQISMEFHSHGFDNGYKLTPKIEKALYRIFQESLSNIIRHSKATHASFQLIRDDRFVHFLVEDDGVGFSVQGANFVPGIGLKGIRKRVTKLKGTLEIDSRPGKGTTLSIDIPIT